jgi:hypothetical protein
MNQHFWLGVLIGTSIVMPVWAAIFVLVDWWMS